MDRARPPLPVLGRISLILIIALNLVIGSVKLTPGILTASAAGTPTLLISEFLANPNGTDSPFEWVELRATGAIDFTTTPFSVVVSNNGTATANGWIAGGSLTYGFSITTGSIAEGDVVYVGGSSMAPTGTKLRTINTGTTAGDRFGTAASGGVFGNGGGNADGIAVFADNINNLTSSTVPADAIFFGTGLGTAVVSGGTAGYELPVNDTYNGGKLQTTSYIAADAGSDQLIVATGVYNPTTGSFTTPRTWATAAFPSAFTDGTSAVTLSTASPSPSPSPSASPSASPSPTSGASVQATYTLPNTRINTLENVANDRGFFIGGIGSDLYHRPGDAPDEFWMITDRGPNGQITVGNETRRTFPIPDFDPVILHVKVSSTAITILQTLPILTATGQPVTGLSNQLPRDEQPYNYDATQTIPLNPNGLDTEGLVRAPDGTFWVDEEYSPSILHIAADGKVIKRYVPQGLGLTGTDYPVAEALPSILAKRKGNRGFEGLGISPDGKTLYAVVQSPLANPTQSAGNPSRLIRILTFDVATETVTGEYVYQFEAQPGFDPAHPQPQEMKASAIVAIDGDTLLVEERTDWVAKLFVAELAGATSILGGTWDDVATSPSLEQVTDLATAGVPVLPKTLRLDITALPNIPLKIEGVAIVNCTTLAIANDNDFDIGNFDANGNIIGAGTTPSVIKLIHLDAPLTPDCVDPRIYIHDIQGMAHISPRNGQTVANVQGIVTAVVFNGFYLQERDADADNNPATSEAIFVFTSTAPGVAVGDAVTVGGTVTEFRPGGSGGANNLTTTEISTPNRTVVVTSSGNALPAATVIGAGGRIPPTTVIDDDATGDVENSGSFDAATDGIDFYESLEAMRVQINNAVAVGPTSLFSAGSASENREIPVLADNGGNGAGARTARGGIIIQPNDYNPERLILNDSGHLVTLPTVNVGTTFPGTILGVVNYAFGNFKIEVTSAPAANTANAVTRETTNLVHATNQLTVATFNVENLSPVGTNSPAVTQEKFTRLAAIIVNNLKSPDIVALEEVQDNNGGCVSDSNRTPTGCDDNTVTADATLSQLLAAIQTAGGPSYSYRSINPVSNQDGGQPYGNIRVVFLFRSDTGVAFVDRAPTTPTCPSGNLSTCAVAVTGTGGATQLTLSPGRIDPTNSAFNTSRKPLAGEFTFNGQKLFVIANHFNSKGGDDGLFGHKQPTVLSSEVQRVQQAQIVRGFVDSLLAADADANIVVLGDLNDFQFSNPLNTLKGTGATQLHVLLETLPANEQYTYVYQGNSQALDHILASPHLFGLLGGYDVVHVNSEFADQDSDHDPQIARFTLAATAPTAANLNVTVTEDTAQVITLQGTTTGGGSLTYTIVAPPTHGTLSAVNGSQVTYTPAANYNGPDSFTYKVNDGTTDSNTATVGITVSAANDAPVAGNGAATTPANTPVAITLTATDSENNTLTYTIVTPPAHGTLSAVNGNQVTYTPANGYSGPDTFTFRANDGTTNSNVATVSITVVAPTPPATVALTVTTTGNGSVTPDSGDRTAGSSVTLTATPDTGSAFIGWRVDGAFAGLTTSLTITMNAAHTVAATFAPTVAFSDTASSPYQQAIAILAASGAILGYGDGRFGPTDHVSRAQMAALIARAMGWDQEDHGNPFTDRNGLNADLWRNVGTLAFYGVAFGYGDGRFGPNDDVSYIQSISFITRAMVARGYWLRASGDDATIYPNVPADSVHRLDLVTFVQHAGLLPEFAVGASGASWQQPATRGWYAAALLQAISSRIATTP